MNTFRVAGKLIEVEPVAFFTKEPQRQAVTVELENGQKVLIDDPKMVAKEELEGEDCYFEIEASIVSKIEKTEEEKKADWTEENIVADFYGQITREGSDYIEVDFGAGKGRFPKVNMDFEPETGDNIALKSVTTKLNNVRRR